VTVPRLVICAAPSSDISGKESGAPLAARVRFCNGLIAPISPASWIDAPAPTVAQDGDVVINVQPPRAGRRGGAAPAR
jgi:hypothetical protein